MLNYYEKFLAMLSDELTCLFLIFDVNIRYLIIYSGGPRKRVNSFLALNVLSPSIAKALLYSLSHSLLGLSIAKVLVWFIGEISYEDLFLEQQLEYVEIATIILFIFFITMNIAFINLLVSFCYIKANIGANRLG